MSPDDATATGTANGAGISTDNNDGSEAETMLAYVVSGTSGSLQRVAKPKLPQPKSPDADWALVRVLRAGVCNTDLEILKGYMGFSGVLGHEFVGVVEEVNADSGSGCPSSEWLGKRVCGDINVACRQEDCNVCRGDYDSDACCSKMSRNHCPNRTVLGILKHHGTMAEYLALPIENLHVVPNSISDEEAVFAEPLAAACRIVEQGLVSEKDRVAILGDGKLGLMIAEVLGSQYSKTSAGDDQSRPVLFGKHKHKLALVEGTGCIETKLLHECSTSSENGELEVLPEYTARYDVVVDATGSPHGLALCRALCRPMGTLVLKSTCAAGSAFHAAPLVIDELRVVGSRCGPIDTALDMLRDEQKSLNVLKYVTKTFQLDQAVAALECAAQKSTMKVQIVV